jgi:hypothetical protein
MEKRRHTRTNFQIQALLYHNLSEYSGHVINLSMRGALIESDDILEIPVDSLLEVRLLIIGASSTLKINFRGLLVRSEENFLGFKIESMDLDSFIHLKNIIAYNNGDYDKIMEEFIENIN